MSSRALTLLPTFALCGCLFLDGPGQTTNNTPDPPPADMSMTEPGDMGSSEDASINPPDPVDMGMTDPGDAGMPGDVVVPEDDMVEPPEDLVEFECPPRAPVPGSSNDWITLTDTFEKPERLSSWTLLHDEECWGPESSLFETYEIAPNGNIGATNVPPGRGLQIIPRTSAWYRDLRGQLAFKNVRGDFKVVTHVYVSSTNGGNIPMARFSLAGLMARVPQAPPEPDVPYIGPVDWEPESENYVFLGMGMGDERRVVEVKDTVGGDTTVSPVGYSERSVILALTRVDNTFFMFRMAPNATNAQWIFTDQVSFAPGVLPDVLQVGVTAYSDFYSLQNLRDEALFGYHLGEFEGGEADLEAQFFQIAFQEVDIRTDLRARIRSGTQVGSGITVEEAREHLAPSPPSAD